MNQLINLAHDYFTAWNTNDVEKLKPMFHNDIVLIDWDVSVAGFDKVILTNQNIFKAVPGISAEILNIVIGDDIAIAQLKVHINENEVIDVVDVLTFTDNKISAIRAYKG